MLEIKFRGRGGQGAVVASEMLGKAFFLEGKWPQAFSLFGSERRGAPVFGFLRVDSGPIYLKCRIKRPDHVIVFDPSLAEDEEVFSELKPEGFALINTCRGIDSFRKWRTFRIGLIDAGAIANSVGLGHNFNTAMLGAYARLTGLIKLDTLISVVRSTAPSRIEENVEAVHRAYDDVRTYAPEEMH